MNPLENDLEEVMYTAAQIRARVVELGAQIARDYAGRNFMLVTILKGGVIFLSDLTRAIEIPHELEFIGASSYGAATVSSGSVRITRDLERDVSGGHVLLCEDIYDTGHTLRKVYDLILMHNPASLRVCALLVKEKQRPVEVPVDYIGFTIPDKFVVGYGLDYAEKYRNLPMIGVLKPACYGAG